MKIKYYFNKELNLPHIYKHNVIEKEVEEVLTNPGEDRIGKDDTRVCIGQTDNGRYLKVIYINNINDNSIFVITAYEINGKVLLAYKKRRRRKHGK